MTHFRWHRGSLADSMETVVSVASFSALEELIHAADWSEGDVVVKPYGFDARINWDTHIVTAGGAVMGFTDGPLSAEPA